MTLYNSYFIGMGNVDMTANESFMKDYSALALDFIRQTPLFYAEDIKFPLSTQGARIVDATGRRVKLAGGNWSGAHMCRHCVDGLECRPLRDLARDIKYKLNLNCIRLTYSLQLFFDNNKVPEKYLKANPELIGKTSMEIFDYTIEVLTQEGIMVLLNNHTSTSQWCCSNDDGDGLWWSYQYPENMFFECAEQFARRYRHNPLVIGIDLRNQLRKAHGIEATWGDGNLLTDWHRAAQICGEKVLKIAPEWLIIVAGLSYQLDLTCVQSRAIKYSVPNKLVYSGHLYSFSWPPSWASFSYEAFKKKLFNSQTFVRGYGYPFMLGEFGNNKRDTLWNYLIRYLKETDIDWVYWPIDGFKCDPDDPDKDQTYGIFTHDFKNIRNHDIFTDLRTIGAPSLPYQPSPQIEKKKENLQKEVVIGGEGKKEDKVVEGHPQEQESVPLNYGKPSKSSNIEELKAFEARGDLEKEKHQSFNQISIAQIIQTADKKFKLGSSHISETPKDKKEEGSDPGEKKRLKIFSPKPGTQ